MKHTAELHVVLARRRTLYAAQYPGRFMPLILLLGLSLWIWMVVLVAGDQGRVAVGILALGSMACFAGALLTLRIGEWLSIDCHRGWIHWCARGLRKNAHESFSPRRIERLAIRRLGFAPPRPGLWIIQLDLDHPRLCSITLARASSRRSTAHHVAGCLAGALGIDWTDEQGRTRSNAIHDCPGEQKPPPSAKQKPPPSAKQKPPPSGSVNPPPRPRSPSIRATAAPASSSLIRSVCRPDGAGFWFMPFYGASGPGRVLSSN
jgi:hypothetical protein